MQCMIGQMWFHASSLFPPAEGGGASGASGGVGVQLADRRSSTTCAVAARLIEWCRKGKLLRHLSVDIGT